jgi:16S rRNA (guanine527-N7)-methyltransferase
MTAVNRLVEVLEDAQRLGFLGPDPVSRHIRHAESWAEVLEPGDFLDLGSGAGVPGLVFAAIWPEISATLLDTQVRRAAWLRIAVVRLEMQDRASVVEGRAEDLAHVPELREHFPLVSARSFGLPAATAECGAGFVRVGGVLTVSEPPQVETGRWSVEALAGLGFDSVRRVVHGGASFVILPKSSAVPSRYPRRRNLPLRSPLW